MLDRIAVQIRAIGLSRQPFQAEAREDSDEGSGHETGKVEKGQIGQDGTESNETGRYHKLSEIMTNTTHDTYSRCGEAWVLFFFYKAHHDQTDDTAGQTV